MTASAITRLDPVDLPAAERLVALQRAAYAVEAAIIGTDVIPALRETAEDLAAANLRILGEPRGFVAYAREGDLVDIHRLVVDPDAFRRGVATRLLDALDDEEPDAARQIVSTAAANAPALALYARRGFTSIREELVTDGLRIVTLERRQPAV